MKKHILLLFLLLIISAIAHCQSGQSTIIVNSTLSTDTSLVARELIYLTDGFSFTAASGKSFSASIDPDLEIPVYLSGDQLIDPENRELDKSLPVGTLPGSIEVNSLGAAVCNIPVFVSPGTAGLQPEISIIYNSMTGSGLLGRGWDIAGISTIHRVPGDYYHDGENAAIGLHSADRFALDSNRLVLASGTYGTDGSVYKTEIETFSRITAHGSAGSGPSWFEVETKDGRTIQYGNSASSRVEAPGTSTALLWRINRITDNYGNYINYTYFEQGGESYIEKIEYTGNTETNLAPCNTLRFEYTARADSNFHYVAGRKITEKALLTSIRMETEGGALVRRYELRYNLDFYTHLVGITQYGSDNKYQNSTVISWGETKTAVSSSDSFSNNRKNEFYRGDYNGDGRTDLVMTEKKTSFTSSDKWELWLADSYGTSFTKKNEGYLSSTFKGFTVSDCDGDGKSDLYSKKYELVPYDCNPHPCDEQMSVVSDSADVQAELTDTTLVSSSDSTLQIGDIDNIILNPPPPPQDTCYDVCYRYNTQFLYYYYSEQSGIVRGSTSKDLIYDDCPGELTLNPADLDGNGQSDYIVLDQYRQVYSIAGVYYLGNNPFLYDFKIADFNGDGIDDILSVGPFSSTVLQYDPVAEDFDTLYLSSSFPDPDDRLFTGDFNGDKKTDLLVWNSVWSLKFSTGAGFESSSAVPALTNTDPGSSENDNNVYISDLNGDKKDDILEIYLSGSSSVLRRFFSRGAGVFVSESESFAKSSINQDYSRFGDFNGDGRGDLFFYDHSQASNSVNISFFGRDENRHMIRTISNGLDQKSTVYFSRLNRAGDFYQKGSGSQFPVTDYNGAFYVTDSVDVVNFLELTGNLTKYTYNGFRIHKQGKGVIGFNYISSGDTANGAGIIKEYSYHPDYFFSYPSRVATTGRSGRKASESVNTYSAKEYSGNRFFPYLSSSETTDSLSGGTLRRSSFVYDDYGNMTCDSTIYYSGAAREEYTFSTRVFGSYGNWGVSNKMISRQVTSRYGSEPEYKRKAAFTFNSFGSLLTEVTDPDSSRALTRSYSAYNDY
ncbi:MAG: hypothetical protein MUE32_03605, partial [Bacteroidales bacterium]|nr:hypothetical protein [Bacteroidales bacterium]